SSLWEPLEGALIFATGRRWRAMRRRRAQSETLRGLERCWAGTEISRHDPALDVRRSRGDRLRRRQVDRYQMRRVRRERGVRGGSNTILDDQIRCSVAVDVHGESRAGYRTRASETARSVTEVDLVVRAV